MRALELVTLLLSFALSACGGATFTSTLFEDVADADASPAADAPEDSSHEDLDDASASDALSDVAGDVADVGADTAPPRDTCCQTPGGANSCTVGSFLCEATGKHCGACPIGTPCDWESEHGDAASGIVVACP